MNSPNRKKSLGFKRDEEIRDAPSTIYRYDSDSDSSSSSHQMQATGACKRYIKISICF